MEREKQWNEQQDGILAQTILTHLENRRTQLEGFQAAAQLLGRTAAACGFRWNKEVRKDYADQLAQIKENKSIVKNVKRTRSVDVVAKVSSSVAGGVITEASYFIEQLVEENKELKMLLAKRDNEIVILTGVLQKAREAITSEYSSSSKKRSLRAEA
jgi:prespore-specific regulator